MEINFKMANTKQIKSNFVAVGFDLKALLSVKYTIKHPTTGNIK